MFNRLRCTLIEENIVPQIKLSKHIFELLKFYLNEKSSKEAFEAFINCAIVAGAYEEAFKYFIELGLKNTPVLRRTNDERPVQKPWQ
jgi:hypothetical protein